MFLSLLIFWKLLPTDELQFSGIHSFWFTSLVVSPPPAESEAGVVRTGAEGARPQRASVALHLPRSAPGPAQRPRHTPQDLHAPQKVSGGHRVSHLHYVEILHHHPPLLSLFHLRNTSGFVFYSEKKLFPPTSHVFQFPLISLSMFRMYSMFHFCPFLIF